MNELDVLQKTCVQVYQADIYQGSAVLVEIEQHYYIISAAHVFYSDFDELLSIEKFHGISEEYGQLKFEKPLGTNEEHEEHDIVVIPVDNLVEFSGFPKVQFCEDISFPDLSFVFRGTAKSPAQKPHSVGPCCSGLIKPDSFLDDIISTYRS